jgi:hypothetical protein
VTCENKAKELYGRAGLKIEPPIRVIPWLSNFLYGFRGYHRMIWPLRENQDAKAETGAVS